MSLQRKKQNKIKKNWKLKKGKLILSNNENNNN